jgi:mono/diheme cytochrome c family protein
MIRQLMLSCALMAAAWPAAAQDAGTDIWSGLFSEEQVARGKELYVANCAECHGPNLTPGDEDIASLTAPAFRWSWQTKTLAEKFTKVTTTMPPGKAGAISDQDYLDIVTFILNFNGYPTGEGELTPDPARLEQIVLTLEP